MLRFHGSRDKETFELVGYNSRLDELQAALLRITLPHLDGWCDGRRAAAAHYEEAGLARSSSCRSRRPARAPAWHLYVVRHPEPDALAAALKAAEIGNKAYYRVPAHRQPAMREYGDGLELPGDRGARADASRDPDEPGARPGAGRRGRRGGARRRRQ